MTARRTVKPRTATKLDPKKAARSSRRQASTTPAMVQRLADSFLYALDPAVVKHAHARAATLLMTESEGVAEDIDEEAVARWVGETADAELRRTSPKALEAYKDYGGDIQNAFMEPSFCLGFSLAYLLFAEKGGAQ